MNVLVVGGAGYIGSHMIRLLDASGHRVVTLDNLSEGHRDAVIVGKLVVGEMSDRKCVEALLRDEKIEAVIHFAASALVGESVSHPAKYYGNNVVATFELLEAMRACDVKKLVFSSTCATYGQPQVVPIQENEKQQPVNPYGFTKLVIERMLDDYAHAYGFGFAALRYFNACGASVDGRIGEDHQPESHLIPIVLQVALGLRQAVSVFGRDYPTPDGTCIRDYIHVDDLGSAHLAALQALQPAHGIKLNLGTGRGYSVLEVIETCRKVTGHPIPATWGERRAGDPAELVADASAAFQTLGWRARYQDLTEIVETAWRWHRTHPQGYGDR